MHWANQCPHKSTSGTFYTDADSELLLSTDCENITLFESDIDSPQTMSNLMAESFNCAVIDCGASKTVCGQEWFRVMYDSLNEDEKKSVCQEPSSGSFRFGDGKQAKSEMMVTFLQKLETPWSKLSQMWLTPIFLCFSLENLSVKQV